MKPAADREAMLAAVLANDHATVRALLRIEPDAPPLIVGHNDATTLPVEPDRVLDARLEAVEARVDLKFAELRGDINSHLGEIKAELARKPGIGTLIGTATAVVALILGALAYGGDRLQMGIGLADKRQEQLAKDAAQDRIATDIDKKLDILLAGQRGGAARR